MPDLEERLEGLHRQVPPTRPPLGLADLRARVARRRRRRVLVAGVPLLAVALVLGGFVVGRRSDDGGLRVETVDEGPAPGPGTSDGSDGPDVPGSTPRLTTEQRHLVDLVATIVDLRDALSQETLDAAAWTATPDATVDLASHRAATDVAVARYLDAAATVQGERFGVTPDPHLQRAESRLASLPTIRRSVDARQTNALGIIEQYWLTADDLSQVEYGLLSDEQAPAMNRQLVSNRNLAALTDDEVRLSTLGLLASTIGFFPSGLPTGSMPASRAADWTPSCDDDAAAAGDGCPLYARLVGIGDEVRTATGVFDDWATSDEKLVLRTAQAGHAEREALARTIVSDGQGHNDLTGATPGTTAVDPVTWRRVSDDYLAAMFGAERDLVDRLR